MGHLTPAEQGGGRVGSGRHGHGYRREQWERRFIEGREDRPVAASIGGVFQHHVLTRIRIVAGCRAGGDLEAESHLTSIAQVEWDRPGRSLPVPIEVQRSPRHRPTGIADRAVLYVGEHGSGRGVQVVKGHDAFHATLENDGLSQAEQRVLGHRFEGGHLARRHLHQDAVGDAPAACGAGHGQLEPGVRERPGRRIGGLGVAHESGRAPGKLVEGGVEGRVHGQLHGTELADAQVGQVIGREGERWRHGCSEDEVEGLRTAAHGEFPMHGKGVASHGGERDGLALCEHGVRVAGERPERVVQYDR